MKEAAVDVIPNLTHDHIIPDLSQPELAEKIGNVCSQLNEWKGCF